MVILLYKLGIVGQTKYLSTLPGLETSVSDILPSDAVINPENSGGPLLDLKRAPY